MKIRLLSPQRLIVPAGTEIDIDAGRAALLIEIGAAEIAEAVLETADEELVAETPEKPKRTTRKKG